MLNNSLSLTIGNIIRTTPCGRHVSAVLNPPGSLHTRGTRASINYYHIASSIYVVLIVINVTFILQLYRIDVLCLLRHARHLHHTRFRAVVRSDTRCNRKRSTPSSAPHNHRWVFNNGHTSPGSPDSHYLGQHSYVIGIIISL